MEAIEVDRLLLLGMFVMVIVLVIVSMIAFVNVLNDYLLLLVIV